MTPRGRALLASAVLGSLTLITWVMNDQLRDPSIMILDAGLLVTALICLSVGIARRS